MNELYPMIFKRKTIKKFDENLKLTKRELNKIDKYIKNLIPLIPDIDIDYKIVDRYKTTCTKGEYCILVYSKLKESALLNIGYMLEQLDLYLASINIGVCWYGKGKTDIVNNNDLDFIIMLSIGKLNEKDFRKDYTKAKRKDIDTIWIGKFALDVANVVRYAPSTCNLQPWLVYTEKNLIKVYRRLDVKSKIYKDKILYYNTIDMGIFIYFLDLTLKEKGYKYKKLFLEETNKSNLEPIVMYVIE